MDYNGNINQEKELEEENTLSQKKNNFPKKLKIELNNEEKIEKALKNEEESNQNNENDDSLSYTTLYRSSQSSFNKNTKDIEFTINRRLSSNISTSQSDINYQELNGFSSEKKYFSQKSIKRIQPINLFENDFGNAITNYYKDTEDNLKTLYLNKNNYKKTKNYIKKEIYYKDYDDDNNDYLKYKTIDFSEENKNKANENKKTNANTNNSFISSNKDFLKNNEEKPLNDLNKINNKNNNEQNKNNIQITNINNNYYVNQIFLNPNNNFNTINGSKYDVSMYYLGYYSFDCKS